MKPVNIFHRKLKHITNCYSSIIGFTEEPNFYTTYTVNDDVGSYSILWILVGVAIVLVVIAIGAGVLFRTWITRRKGHGKDVNDGDASISVAERRIKSRRISLSDVINGRIDPPPSAKEFNDLVTFQDDDLGQRLTRYQGKRFNKLGSLNLVPTVLPFDHNRVTLRNPIDGYDYVNASLISQATSDDPSYDEVLYSSTMPFSKMKVIVGQDPLSHTLQHHWALLHENAVDLVINFNKNSLKNGKVYRFGDVSVRVLNERKVSAFLSVTDIKLINISTPGNQYMHDIKVYHVLGWPEETTMSDEQINGIVSALVLLRKEIKAEMDNAKIMLHDSKGGIGPSAVVVALLQLFEQIDDNLTEQNTLKKSAEKLDIFDTVNKLRMDRADMVSTFESYKLIYQCVEHYGNQRLVFQKMKSNDTSKTPACVSAPKISTPKSNIAEIIKTKNKQQEIGEEYVLHHDYANEPDNLFDDIYDEYVIEEE